MSTKVEKATGPFVAVKGQDGMLGETWNVKTVGGVNITMIGGGGNVGKSARMYAASLNSAWAKAGGPDLLAACTAALVNIDFGPNREAPLAMQLRAAIAKARGG